MPFDGLVRNSAPALWVVRVDSEAKFADELVRQEGVAGMEASHAYVAEKLLESVSFERPGAAGEIQRAVHNLECFVDDERSCRNEAHRPILMLNTGPTFEIVGSSPLSGFCL